MASFNKVILMGNLTRDPELRVTPKGTAVCQLGLAVNSTYKDKEGNTKEEVTFVDIDVFGRQAEVIAKYMSKGRPILVEGRLKQDSWDDKKTGEKRNKMKVVLENFQFVGSRGEGGEGAASSGGSSGAEETTTPPPPRAARPGNAAPAKSAGVDEEDVPF
jgi:single-strand DNA-binding protein